MNVAIILAGGANDPRFKSDLPKQFTNVYNRPIIVYTLEIFQKHQEIDSIVVSCLDGWSQMVNAYAKQFNITKLSKIVTSGATGQESARKAVISLQDTCKNDDIIVIHDSIRPLVSPEIISDSIAVCKTYGMGVAAVCSMDTIMKTKDGKVGEESISRYDIMRVQTPQAYTYGDLLWSHLEAVNQHIEGAVDTNTIMSRLGRKICFSKGSDLNLKINTLEDVEMFKVLYKMKNESELE